MSDAERYKCPFCGGTFEFDIKTQKLKCPFCDSVLSQEEYDAMAENKKSKNNVDIKDGATELDKDPETGEDIENKDQATYVCKSCGGAITPALTSISEKCPFCGSPIILTNKIKDAQPDVIIPFKLDLKAVQEAYTKHITTKSFVPKSFATTATKNEIHSVYVPFWLLSCKADGEVNFAAKNIRTERIADRKIVYSDHYSVFRHSKMDFNDIPADASSEMDDSLMDSIEPFNTLEALDFKTAYLSGYDAQKYDVNFDDLYPRFEKRLVQSFLTTVRNNIGNYDRIEIKNYNIEFNDREIKYALFPIWIVKNTWNGEDFIFAMNGQTGKMVGNLPTSWGKFFLSSFLSSFLFLIVTYIAMCYFLEGEEQSVIWGVSYFLAIVISLVVHFCMISDHSNVSSAVEAQSYLDFESFHNLKESDKYTHTTKTEERIK